MREQNIIQLAFENLENQTGIIGHGDYKGHRELDGKVMMELGNTNYVLPVEVKKELRPQHIPIIEKMVQKHPDLMIIAHKIYPQVKDYLRKQHIPYLEQAGNFYFDKGNHFIWIETQKTTPGQKEKGNRAFTKTGLKVLLYLLTDNRLLNFTYRDIALATDVALGNVNYIFNGLKDLGFLIKMDEQRLKLVNTRELLDKWVTNYDVKLKPDLLMGKFRFLDENHFVHWQALKLEEGTVWGGEAAGDLYTNYLRPGMLTLYTEDTRQEIMKKYRMLPDSINGNVWVFKKFWRMKPAQNFENAVPPILAYADLITMNEKRCRETAQLIFDEHIKPNL